MSKEKYKQEILDYLVKKNSDLKIGPRKLARRMGILDEDYSDFRNAFKKLRDEDRYISGSGKTLTFPNGESSVLGRFIANPKGFGFVVPDDKTLHSDMFIPAGRTLGALEGDIVFAQLVKTDKKDGELRYAGEITEIKERANSGVIGTLEKSGSTWFVVPDGRRFSKPVVIRDITLEQQKEGAKVKADIIWFPDDNSMPEGIISDTFGLAGEPRAEIEAVMASFNLAGRFSDAALRDAKESSDNFDPDNPQNREDLTDKIIVTIDPDEAKDYDDAISLESLPNGGFRLGVHIADVSYFVKEGSALDEESKRRGVSVYFPRFVVPMLPPMLSNGLCSLQEGVKRYAMSAYIDYTKEGEVTAQRVARSVIKSSRRLTYKGAQDIIDKKTRDENPGVNDLLDTMLVLATTIEKRRKAAGMIHLNLPEIELELDDAGKVTGAYPADSSYTHKMIEMFMVEANEAVARIIDKKELPFIRRIHPPPEAESILQLSRFVKAVGYDLAPIPGLTGIMKLVDDVADAPEAYAVNLAVLRSFQRAVYSTEDVGHFALASRYYAHFTSPIRRYPDLTIHRQLGTIIDGGDFGDTEKLEKDLSALAKELSAAERVAQNAETELRLVLVLQHLSTKKGELFNGVITGVADFGVFVQHPQFLIEGLIRITDLGDDWWDVSTELGSVRGEYSGKVYKIGTVIEVRIDGVDIPKRQLSLSLSTSKVQLSVDHGGSSAERSMPGKISPRDNNGSRDNKGPRGSSNGPRDNKGPRGNQSSNDKNEKSEHYKGTERKKSKKSGGKKNTDSVAFQLKTGLGKDKKAGRKKPKDSVSKNKGKPKPSKKR
ncbi:MAG: ribonuclease R [Deltaproteobacteria bacterium]|nr:ribonuclease R [Deltaproteobacteria bacterium]